MLLARHPYLEHWDFPWPLILVFLLNLAAAVYCAIVLRLGAEKARRTVLDRLRDRLLGAAGTGKEREAALRLVIQQIQQEQEGAFGPLTSNPILNALAVPIGGISLVAILEQLPRWF